MGNYIRDTYFSIEHYDLFLFLQFKSNLLNQDYLNYILMILSNRLVSKVDYFKN